jgi:hypothetical protein
MFISIKGKMKDSFEEGQGFGETISLDIISKD